MRSGPASSLPVVRVLAAASLALAWGCARVEQQVRPVEGAAERRAGGLVLRPARFSETDFYLWPTTVDAEEGRLAVGPGAEIHWVRFPARTRSPGPPIVYLAGGPGGSGTWSASGDRFGLFMRLRGVADVVALDQRGTAYTRPHAWCPGAWSYPLDRPWDERTLAGVLRPYLQRCAAELGDSVPPDAFSAVQGADDLEALRIALGAERLSLWGISYGTHLALAYLRRYPHRVHRAVLAGVEGPDHTWKLPANVDRVLLRVDSALRADPRASRELPDLAGQLRRTLARLERAPATVEVEHPRTGERVRVTVGAEDLRRAVFHALGEREDVAQLPARLIPVFRGDYRPLALFALRTRLDNAELAMALSTDCAAGASPGRRAAIRRQAAAALLGDAANASLRARCAAWPVPELGAEHRAPVRSAVPVLFVSGTLDARTPPENAAEVLAGFPNGRHLVIEGGSHDDDLFLSSPRIARAMEAFLRGGEPRLERVVLPPLRFRLR